MIVCVLTTLVVRVVVFLSFQNTPIYQPLEGSQHDRAIYLAAAEAASNGSFLPEGALEFLPLYPWLIGIIGMVFGTGPLTAAVLGILCDLATTALIVLFARRLGATNILTAAAGLLYALYPLAILYSLLAMPNTLNTLCVTAFAYLAYRLIEEGGSPGGFALPGKGVETQAGRSVPLSRNQIRCYGLFFLLGLFAGILTLGFAGMMLIVFAVAAYTAVKKKAFAAVAVLLLGTALPIAPVAMHNSRAEGSFVMLTTHGGLNFYMGNHEGATGYPLRIANFRMTAKLMLEDAHRHAEQRTGRTMTRAESSAWWNDQAGTFWREKPSHAILLTLKKLALFWNQRDMDDLRILEQLRLTEPFFANFFGTPFAVFGALGLIGTFFCKGSRMPRIILLAGMLGIVLFFITARYRLTFVPLMAVLGAAGVTSLSAAWKEGRKARALFAIPLALIVLIPFPVRDQRPVDYHNAAIQLVRENRLEDALELVHRGLTIDPNMSTLYSVRGSIFYKQKDFSGAAADYRNALSLDPANPTIAYNLALSLAQAGDYCAAADALAGLQGDEKIAPLYNELRAACTE